MRCGKERRRQLVHHRRRSESGQVGSRLSLSLSPAYTLSGNTRQEDYVVTPVTAGQQALEGSSPGEEVGTASAFAPNSCFSLSLARTDERTLNSAARASITDELCAPTLAQTASRRHKLERGEAGEPRPELKPLRPVASSFVHGARLVRVAQKRARSSPRSFSLLCTPSLVPRASS